MDTNNPIGQRAEVKDNALLGSGSESTRARFRIAQFDLDNMLMPKALARDNIPTDRFGAGSPSFRMVEREITSLFDGIHIVSCHFRWRVEFLITNTNVFQYICRAVLSFYALTGFVCIQFQQVNKCTQPYSYVQST